MNIKPFRVRILNEDEFNKIQENVVRNGYKWAGGNLFISYSYYIKYIVFRSEDDESKIKHLYYNWDNDCDNNIPLITFEEFINRYGLKAERKIKLERLNQC